MEERLRSTRVSKAVGNLPRPSGLRAAGRFRFPPRSPAASPKSWIGKRTYSKQVTKQDLGDRLIIRTPRGRPIHERNLVQRAFKPLLKRAGLPDLRLYDLRHTFATLALRAGVPTRLVSEQLGHRSIAFTLETYGQLLEESRGSGPKLSDLIFGPGTGAESERKPIAGEMAEPFEKRA